jgi:hypothetical protein
MTRTLADYDDQVGQHLHAIVHGAEMVKSHVGQLVYRPHFETLAFEEIEDLERLLGAALRMVSNAKRAYREKPVGD